MSIISISNLNKTFKVHTRKPGVKNAFKSFFKREFKEIKAVNNISFSINKGEIVGYIGPNGAGKSTTIKMLTGILKPDSGTIRVMGKNPFKNRVDYVKDIGVVFGQKSQLWWDIAVIDSFELLRDIYKIKEKDYKKTLDELVDLLDIEDLLTMPVRQLSLGQRMRCEIVASLLHKPKILFLDEPTIGLDAISKVVVRNFIKKINKTQKITIILTSHDMSDIEALTNRIIMIGNGIKLYDGSFSEIKKKYANKKKVEILFTELKKIPKINNVRVLEKSSNRVLLDIEDRNIKISKIISEYSKECEINDVNLLPDDLNEIIVNLYKEYNL